MSTTPGISAFLSVPTTPSHKLQVAVNNKQLIYITKLQTSFISTINHPKTYSLNLIPFRPFASTSSSTGIEEEEDQEKEKGDEPSPSDNDDVFLQSEASTLDQEVQEDPGSISSVSVCRACGKKEIERGCNGEGRIQGGIATVPGFGWWPIKAYRPCPSYLATGGRYRRSGQSMDEIGFGGGGREAPSAGNGEVAQSSSKKPGVKKLKT